MDDVKKNNALPADDDAQQEERDPQLQELLDKIENYHPNDDMQLVERAYNFACAAHAGQMRKSGKPYFTHPFRVAEILADLMLDATTIAAGLLHDCVEDIEEITVEVIEEHFGQDVALLVDGVTKLSRLDFTSKEEQQAESLRKMFLSMAKDIRVVLIKLADRLHNMRTLKFQDPTRQAAIARETLDVYAPLAHRLGMYSLKWEMEDLSLRYIDAAGYYDLVEKVGMKRQEREKSIQDVIDTLKKKLDEANINCDIEGRPKHFYSIYRKMVLQNKSFEQIHDLIAIRVLVETVPECYAVLGIVHTLWRQLPNRFKDYISMPKANMYQSLHTTVVGSGGMTFEVQIRTHEMHRTAEYGIAAHWRYKEGRQEDELDHKLFWLRQILDWQGETRDPHEFMDALKVDLFSDEVFVFTPKGDVITLPTGATPLDFAYRIHTEIGNKCVGAKINGRIVPLETPLKTGDFIEVLTSSSSNGPSRDWLKIVQTSGAKSKIRAWFKHEFKEENMQKGKEMLEKEAKRFNFGLSQLTKSEYMEPLYRRHSINSLEDLYVTVGFGGLSAAQVVHRLVEEYEKHNKPESVPIPQVVDAAQLQQAKEVSSQKKSSRSSSNGIIVAGEPGMVVRFAKCCNPLPGDDIVGYITRGRGVSVHRSDCTNMSEQNVESERMVEVHWEHETSTAYHAEIQIMAYDRVQLLGDLSVMLAQNNVPIVALSARTHKKGTTTINMVIQTKNTNQLDKIIAQLQKRSDIIEVFRVSS